MILSLKLKRIINLLKFFSLLVALYVSGCFHVPSSNLGTLIMTFCLVRQKQCNLETTTKNNLNCPFHKLKQPRVIEAILLYTY